MVMVVKPRKKLRSVLAIVGLVVIAGFGSLLWFVVFLMWLWS